MQKHWRQFLEKAQDVLKKLGRAHPGNTKTLTDLAKETTMNWDPVLAEFFKPRATTPRWPVWREDQQLPSGYIWVTGPYSAGKTTFIETISMLPTCAVSRYAARPKPEALPEFCEFGADLGCIEAEAYYLVLFGTPGAIRPGRWMFEPDIGANKLLGVVILVDSTQPCTFREFRSTLNTIFRAPDWPCPYVIGATRQDKAEAWEVEDLRIALGLWKDEVLVPCSGHDRESVKAVLLSLLELVKNAPLLTEK